MAILRDCHPGLDVDVIVLEHARQSVPKSLVRRAGWPVVLHEAGEKFARRAREVHASDMPGPAQETGVVVVLDGLDAKLFEEIGGFDVVFDGVMHGDLGHDARALVMKGEEAAQEVLCHAPALTAVEQDGDDERGVDHALDPPADSLLRENARAERAKGRRRVSDALVDVRFGCQCVVDDGPQVLEGVGEAYVAVSNIEVGGVAFLVLGAACWAVHRFRL